MFHAPDAFLSWFHTWRAGHAHLPMPMAAFSKTVRKRFIKAGVRKLAQRASWGLHGPSAAQPWDQQ
jgi:hypothetical protein